MVGNSLPEYGADTAAKAATALVEPCSDADLLTVIFLPTEWNEVHVIRSLASVANLMLLANRAVNCLVFETLPPAVSFHRLLDQPETPLPEFVRNCLEREGFDYLVDHAYTARALRRAVRCARGRYVCLLREGDVLGYRLTADQYLKCDYDVLLGVAAAGPHSDRAHEVLAEQSHSIRGMCSLITAMATYDGALICRRDFLDDTLGEISCESEPGFPGYLNEVLVPALLARSACVGFTRSIAVFPLAEHSKRHMRLLDSGLLFRIEQRCINQVRMYDEQTVVLIRAVLRLVCQVFGGKVDSAAACDVELSKDYLSGNASAGVLTAISWIQAQITLGLMLTPATVHLRQMGLASDFIPDSKTSPLVSMVSSAFGGQKLIFSFLENLVQQTIFQRSEILIVSPKANLVQDLVGEYFALCFNNIRLIQLNADPGIYECWNIAIRQAKGEYVTNANLDDRRAALHLESVINAMQAQEADVGSAAVVVTENFDEIESAIKSSQAIAKPGVREVWFGGGREANVTKGLSDFFEFDEAGRVRQCMNFPHCMPVWRRALHDRLGYFDEAKHGTYADFAFWLQAVKNDVRFVHLSEPLGLYLADPQSHNRRNANRIKWENVVRAYLPDDVEICAHETLGRSVVSNSSASVPQSEVKAPKLNFGAQLAQHFGTHRSGWAYALSGLESFHDPLAAVECNTFIEKRFVWGSDAGDGGCGSVKPHAQPWVGFLHVPPFVPSWFQFEQSNEQIFRKTSWRESLPHCRGLFVLSEHHRRHLLPVLRPAFPVSVLHHPTEFPEVTFDFDRYLENPRKRLVQIGWWLRKLNAVMKLRLENHVPTLLGGGDWNKNMLLYAERRYYSIATREPVDTLDFLDNDSYDALLSANLVFVHFYDTSANNAVIECIARGTPLIVMRHPAVEEYLGADYPLYFDDFMQIPNYLNDRGRLLSAHKHLCQPLIRSKVSLDSFTRAFASSEVMANVG